MSTANIIATGSVSNLDKLAAILGVDANALKEE